MILPAFRFHRPASIEEALLIAGDCGGDFDYVGGGTDLIPNYKNRLNPKRNVISLAHARSLAEPIRREARGGYTMGAMCRLLDLEKDPRMQGWLPGLVEAVSKVATPLVRQAGTIGGNQLVETRCYYFNQTFDWRASRGFCMKADGDVCLVVPQKEICYAVYAGDTAPALMTLGARFVLVGLEGSREVAASEFFRPDGIRKNVLAKDEVLAEIRIPEEASRARSGYEKLRLRDSFDFPDMGVAAALWTDSGRIRRLRIAVTAVSMTPALFPEVTDSLEGEVLTPDLIRHVADAVQQSAKPVRNVLFPPQYRKKMVGVFTRRLLTRLAGL